MKKFLSMLLILALAASVFTACGDKPASSGSTTDAPAASSSEPEPQEPPYDPAVLTGLPKSDDYPEGQRVTAVMVNNISNTSYQQARPQNGLSEADVLIEIKVEGGITRFCALFTDYRDLPEICPVRSARDQFFQLILPLQPLYVHIGESVVQTQYVKDYSYQDMDLNLDRMGDFPRDASKGNVAREHTAYVDGDFIQKAIDALGADTRRDYTSPIFDFVNYNEPARVLTGDNALGITIEHSQSYRTYFDWDAAAGKYLMSQYSYAARDILPSTDANNGTQLSFDNVIVLFTDFDVYPDPGGSGYDLQKVDYTFGGVGYYFNGGKAEPIRWKKGSPLEALYLVDTEGNETSVKVNPGKTYLAVVDLEEAGKFSYDAGAAATDTAEVPTGDNTSSGTQSASSASAPGASPLIPDGPAPEINLITGEALAEGLAAGDRPVAVMVNNAQAALPQRGIGSADAVFEMVTEGGITRLLALYADKDTVPQVGPVRSARDQHLQCAMPLNSVIVHIGTSIYAENLLNQYQYSTINGMYLGSTSFVFDEARSAAGYANEHCWYTDAALIAAGMEKLGLSGTGASQALFDFVAHDAQPVVPAQGDAADVAFSFSDSGAVTLTYDAAAAKYLKTAYGAPQVDESTGAQLAFDNVLVLFTDIKLKNPDDPNNLVTDFAMSSGTGYYCYGGKFRAVTWEKGNPEDPLRLKDENGAALQVNVGKSYVAIVGKDREGTLLFGGVSPTGVIGGEGASSDAQSGAAASAEPEL